MAWSAGPEATRVASPRSRARFELQDDSSAFRDRESPRCKDLSGTFRPELGCGSKSYGNDTR
jgi:hypothetical protein